MAEQSDPQTTPKVRTLFITNAALVICTPLMQVGAFLSTPGGCVAVNNASNLASPFVTMFAPDVVGSCDDIDLEGNVYFTSSGEQMRMAKRCAFRYPERQR